MEFIVRNYGGPARYRVTATAGGEVLTGISPSVLDLSTSGEQRVIVTLPARIIAAARTRLELSVVASTEDQNQPSWNSAFLRLAGLPARERYFIEGSYHQMKGELPRAIAAYEALIAEQPNDFWGQSNLASSLRGEPRGSNSRERVAHAGTREAHTISRQRPVSDGSEVVRKRCSCSESATRTARSSADVTGTD